MPQFTSLPTEPFLSFERGINRDAAKTLVDRGYYDDAVNILLSSDTSARHPATVKLDAKLDAQISWPGGNVYWFSPFTYSSYDSGTGVLTFSTHLLIHRSDGSFYRYDAGSPGTTTLVRRLSSAVQLTTHFIYDQWLCVLNGRDAPLKYGQHLLWDGQAEARPYLFPIGSKPVSPLDPGVTGETVTLGGSSTFVADASTPGGGARVGTHVLRVAPSSNVVIEFYADRNFLAGPRPYGGTDFASTDSFVLQYLKTASAGNFRVRFGDNAGANYFEFLYAGGIVADGTWRTEPRQRSTVTTTGTPNWNAIRRVTIFNDDAVHPLYLDDLYFLYANAPPAALVGTAHKDRMVLGGAPVAGADNDPALSTLFWSPVSKPDEFPSANQQIISGGSTSLARTNRITALREYGDVVIIGTQNAIFSWTVGATGDPSRSVVTTETGIDSPRAIVETPSGSLLFPWQRGFYILRQTGRAYVSEKIAPIMKDVWLDEPWWTVGVRDEKTRTIRFWFRTKPEGSGNPTKTTTGIVFDYVRSQEMGESVWPSRMTQLADFAVEAYLSGSRETLYARFDEADIYRMHNQAGGALESSLTFPWLSLHGRDKVSKWIGATVPYSSTTDVRVFIRYANNPGEFETAEFEEVQPLPAHPTAATQGRIMFGKTSRWAQIKLQAQEYGFEVYPPVEFVAVVTQRVP